MTGAGLGRGLGSLIPPKKTMLNETVGDTLTVADGEKILQVAPNLIKPNPRQPRKNFAASALDDLVESIKQYGILQPLIVSPAVGGYELIAGERRWRSAKLAGLHEVPVIVRQASDQQKLELALIENIQREDLNSLEEALAYRQLMDEFNFTQEALARKISKPRTAVANAMTLLSLPDYIQQVLADGKLSAGQGRILAGMADPEKQKLLFDKTLAEGLSISEMVMVSKSLGGTKKTRVKIDYHDQDCEVRLRQFFDSKAQIRRSSRGGQVVVDFYSDEELEGIMRKIS